MSFGHCFWISADIILLMSFFYLLFYLVLLTLESDPAHVHIHTHLLAPLNSSVSTFKSIGRVVSGQGCHSESSEVDPSLLDLDADS